MAVARGSPNACQYVKHGKDVKSQMDEPGTSLAVLDTGAMTTSAWGLKKKIHMYITACLLPALVSGRRRTMPPQSHR